MHWEHRALATGPPGKSHAITVLNVEPQISASYFHKVKGRESERTQLSEDITALFKWPIRYLLICIVAFREKTLSIWFDHAGFSRVSFLFHNLLCKQKNTRPAVWHVGENPSVLNIKHPLGVLPCGAGKSEPSPYSPS